MASRTRHGNETGDTGSFILAGTTVPTTVTSPVNSGTNAWSIATGAVTSFVEFQYTPPALDLAHYFRIYFRMGSGPAALSRLLEVVTPFPSSQIPGSIRIDTNRTLKLWDRLGFPVGGASAVLAVDTWHYAELGILIPATGSGQLGMRVNGTEVVAMTTADVGNATFDRVRAGKDTATTITNLYVDDYGYNDSTGASSNSWVGGIAGGGDTTPPETTIDSGPVGTVNSSTATFTFSANETSTFEVRLDAGAWSVSGSPKVYQNLTNGSHTFEVRAIDSSLNVDPSPASRTWTVNVTAPIVTLLWNTPPTPTDFSTISGNTTIEVLTTDNSKIQRIEYYWNDVLIESVGAQQLIAPYDAPWDTTTEQDGTGVLKAVATQTDSQTTQITRTFTIDNQPATANTVSTKIVGSFVSKPILVKIGGSFVSKPIRVIGAALPPTAPFTAIWTSPSSGATISGQSTLTITPSDQNRIDSVLYERDSDGLDLGTTTTPPWSIQANTTVLAEGPVTIKATITYDGNQTLILRRDFTVDNVVTPPPPPTTSGVFRAVPGATWWTTNQTLTNSQGTRGATGTKNFVAGSVGDVVAYITVWDETVSVEDVWLAMKLYGTTWWLKQPPPTVKYGSGTGGIMNVRMVEVTSTGVPRFTDPAAIVAEELNVDPQTRYNQVRNLYPSLAGFTFPSGSDGPMMHYYKLRKNGQAPVVTAGKPYAICVWNSHPQPGVNYFSINPCSIREYIWPPQTPGIADWPTALKGASGRARSPHCIVNMDANMPGAICGLDPRERFMGSTNGGSTFPFVGRILGVDYGGDAEPGNIGMRIPQVPYRRVGQTSLVTKGQLVAGTFDYSVGSNTMDPVPYAITLRQAWAYTISGAAGTITVTHRRGSTTIATATAQMTNTNTGMQIANLSQNLSLAAGDYYTISSSGSGVAWYTVDTNSRLLDPNTASRQWHMGCLPYPYPNGAGKIVT